MSVVPKRKTGTPRSRCFYYTIFIISIVDLIICTPVGQMLYYSCHRKSDGSSRSKLSTLLFIQLYEIHLKPNPHSQPYNVELSTAYSISNLFNLLHIDAPTVHEFEFFCHCGTIIEDGSDIQNLNVTQ